MGKLLQFIVFLFFTLAIIILSCTQKPSEPLRIGTNVWPGYEPLYLARSLKYFDNTSVRLVEFPSSSEVLRAFRNNAIEGAALTLDEVLLLVQSGMDPCLILVMDISHGADVIIGKPELASLEDIKGKRVGVENSALGAYMLSRALEIVGLKINEIKIVPIESSGHERAFKEGKIDAVVTFEPFRTRLLNAGAHKLFDSSRIPGEVVDVLVVRRDYIDKNPQEVRKLLKSWFHALNYMKENSGDAAQRMTGRLRIKPDEIIASFQGLRLPDLNENRKLLGSLNPPLLKTANHLAEVMKEQNLLFKKVEVKPIFNNRLIEDIQL
ncbi:MAG: hypothetical protein A2Z47_01000 [Thermodesulfovibrio sp. RBG_19FT_COMBO_42_12]|nr:MAG: hypothetical protein A2Z47_01000 [Thermodesulfovibrio sp. RBG_19FT_COMBO_42_12]